MVERLVPDELLPPGAPPEAAVDVRPSQPCSAEPTELPLVIVAIDHLIEKLGEDGR
jgi:hypothetical protein